MPRPSLALPALPSSLPSAHSRPCKSGATFVNTDFSTPLKRWALARKGRILSAGTLTRTMPSRSGGDATLASGSLEASGAAGGADGDDGSPIQPTSISVCGEARQPGGPSTVGCSVAPMVGNPDVPARVCPRGGERCRAGRVRKRLRQDAGLHRPEPRPGAQRQHGARSPAGLSLRRGRGAGLRHAPRALRGRVRRSLPLHACPLHGGWWQLADASPAVTGGDAADQVRVLNADELRVLERAPSRVGSVV